MSWRHRLTFALHRAPAPVPDLARRVRDAAGLVYGKARTSLALRRPAMHSVRCHRCLMHTGIPGTWVGADGLCHACHRHDHRYSKTAADRKLAEFLALPSSGKHNMVLAVSGGKDSTAALVLAIEELGLSPLAFLIRHAFLDPGAEARAQSACDELGVPLVVRDLDLTATVQRALNSPTLSPWPCLLCCEAQARVALELCDEHGVRRVGTGLRTLWEDRYAAVTRASYAYRHFRVPSRPDLWIANIIPACHADEARQAAARDRAGYAPPDLPGNTTNCLLHPVFEGLHRQRFGYAWEAERFLSAELRAGAITRATAERAAARNGLDRALLDEVERRAGDR